MEHLVLTRDTTESDIKQRRELSAGSSIFQAGPAVRAALTGRALVIEGIERAEQNLLPILNNLLENREMHLEDGRFLVEAGRYDSLVDPGPDLLRVHPDFWVVALGIPVPPNRGYPLDPPLRSRFQARIVSDPSQSELETILSEVTWKLEFIHLAIQQLHLFILFITLYPFLLPRYQERSHVISIASYPSLRFSRPKKPECCRTSTVEL